MPLIEKPESYYPIVIIGSGPAGLTVALALRDRGIKGVLLVESGALEFDEALAQLSKVEAEGDIEAEYYAGHSSRIFGGTSSVWNGFCSVLGQRSFLEGSWPFSYGDLAEPYRAAAKILDLPDESHEKPWAAIRKAPDLIYKPFFKSPPTRLGPKYLERFQQDSEVDLLLRTTVTQLESEGDQIRNIACVRAGAQYRVGCGRVILATGGLGNPRLLQLSGHGKAARVGLGLMNHPHVYQYGEILLTRSFAREVNSWKSEREHALQLSDRLCLERGLPSFGISFAMDENREALLLGRRLSVSQSKVIIRAEMKPDDRNRVALGQEKDALGSPLANIQFRFRFRQTLEQCWRLLGEQLIRAGLGRITAHRQHYHLAGAGHYMGTTAMGESPETSCVDPNLKFHSFENLYVVGTSVFPAAAAANPTWTLVALAHRLGHHLADLVEVS